nr:purine permease [Bacteroidota bacterium]
MNQGKSGADELIYKLGDKPPLTESLFAALQHLLAIFVPIMTPALIICSALNLDLETTSHLVSLSLLISGISTFIQVKKFGPVGTGLLSIQGTSFSFIDPLIAAGQIGGMSLIFGICLAGSPIEMIISRFITTVKKVITPVVSGSVVVLIGLTLVRASVVEFGGGQQSIAEGTFGSIENLVLGLLVLFTIVILNRSGNRFLRMGSIILGLATGYFIATITGITDLNFPANTAVITIPTPLKYGLNFSFSSFIPVALIYLMTALESMGDITATSLVSDEPVEGELYVKRISGGVMGDGFNSMLASIFNSFPNTTFSQNNGVIQLTGIASRYVGYYISAFLVILGLFPFVGSFFSLMPSPILGGATLLMFGTVTAAGIKVIHQSAMNRYDFLVIAVALSAGLGVELVPEILNHLPEILQQTFKSGITTGGVFAIITQLIVGMGKSTAV